MVIYTRDPTDPRPGSEVDTEELRLCRKQGDSSGKVKRPGWLVVQRTTRESQPPGYLGPLTGGTYDKWNAKSRKSGAFQHYPDRRSGRDLIPLAELHSEERQTKTPPGLDND